MVIGHRSLVIRPNGAPSWPVVAAIGVFTGMLGGFFGVGGGILFVPALIYLLKKPAHEATLTSLAIILPVAITSASVYYVQGHLDPGYTVVLAVGAVLASALLGVPLAAKLSGPALRQAFGLLLALVALRMFIVRSAPNHIHFLPAIFGGGVLIGFVSGFFGVGGGVVAVPLLRALFAVTQHEAHAASLGIMIPTALAGILRGWFGRQYRPDLRTAATWAPGAVVGAFVGPLLADLFRDQALQWAFAGFLLLVSVEMTGLRRWLHKRMTDDR